MPVALESSKTKIARRVIEVFEYFAQGHRSATVMDIVRHFDRPQSSTSELLGSLVEMGLLCKDPQTRTYAPTPRLAALGVAAQPEPIASGRLFTYMDRLAQSSRCGVALFGIVGTHVQVFRWVPAVNDEAHHAGSGKAALLCADTAGLLLLASLGLDKAEKVLWRLRSEARGDDGFDFQLARDRVARFARQGHAIGPSAFGASANVAAVLLPGMQGQANLALGAIYRDAAPVAPEALVATLEHGITHSFRSMPELHAGFLRSVSAG
ncbi:MAG: helix-turn-helix domain-containing protein [Novosphingobium sp.]|nr:helix-turn-helix domain-containing protein [Novosphingobium sp.]